LPRKRFLAPGRPHLEHQKHHADLSRSGLHRMYAERRRWIGRNCLLATTALPKDVVLRYYAVGQRKENDGGQIGLCLTLCHLNAFGKRQEPLVGKWLRTLGLTVGAGFCDVVLYCEAAEMTPESTRFSHSSIARFPLVVPSQ
jgi:hypothetical protein